MKKLYTIPEFKKNTIDNNEVSTNVTTQTICMYKTKVNENETNVNKLGIPRSCGSACHQTLGSR